MVSKFLFSFHGAQEVKRDMNWVCLLLRFCNDQLHAVTTLVWLVFASLWFRIAERAQFYFRKVRADEKQPFEPSIVQATLFNCAHGLVPGLGTGFMQYSLDLVVHGHGVGVRYSFHLWCGPLNLS